MWVFSTIKPSSPDASTYKGMPLDQDDWTCDNWLSYYKANKISQGKDTAMKIVSTDWASTGWFADVNWCSVNCDWSGYFRSEGFDPGGPISRFICPVVKGAGDVIEDTGKTLSIAGKLLPVALFAGIYFTGRKFKWWK